MCAAAVCMHAGAVVSKQRQSFWTQFRCRVEQMLAWANRLAISLHTWANRLANGLHMWLVLFASLARAPGRCPVAGFDVVVHRCVSLQT